jgi:hypothetical protein
MTPVIPEWEKTAVLGGYPRDALAGLDLARRRRSMSRSKMPEAKAALAEAMKLNPELSVARFRARTPSLLDSPPGFREGLIKAGLLEE